MTLVVRYALAAESHILFRTSDDIDGGLVGGSDGKGRVVATDLANRGEFHNLLGTGDQLQRRGEGLRNKPKRAGKEASRKR